MMVFQSYAAWPKVIFCYMVGVLFMLLLPDCLVLLKQAGGSGMYQKKRPPHEKNLKKFNLAS